MEDNLCDTCKQPMTIKRSGKRNSRFLVCLNADCPRKRKPKTFEQEVAKTKPQPERKNDPPSPAPAARPKRLGFFSI